MTSGTAVPAAPAGRLRGAVSDGWTITRRDLAHWAGQPAPVVVTLLFPIMIVLMFGYLFGGAIAVPGGAGYFEFLMPGMFAMTMLFGIEATMSAIATDASRGVTDRFRSMPIARSAVLTGRCTADLLNSAVGLAAMLGCGLAVGWRPHRGAGAALAAVGLLILLRIALLWVGVYFGLVWRDPAAVTAVQTLVWPLGFLSNVFVAPDTMPGWLGTLAEWNPLSAAVAATRELFGNPGWSGESWIAQHSGLMAVVWPLVLLAVFVPLSVRRYRLLDS
jgi:ABC-2 type transport system permease protein